MSANGVVASVANGHDFTKHAAEFSDPNLGRVTSINSPQGLGNLIQDILNDPSTKAISKGDGSIVYIMNKNHNVIIALNESADPKNFGAGTVYKSTMDIEQKFSDLSRSLGDTTIRSQNIQEVNAMVSKYENTIVRQSTKNHMAQPDTQVITQHLDENVRQRGLIVANGADLDQRLQAERNALAQESRIAQENAAVRQNIQDAANHPDSIVQMGSDGKSAVIMDPNGNTYDVQVNPDKTMSVVSELADGVKSEALLSERQALKLSKAVPDLKGLAGLVIVPVIVGGAALVTGSSPAQAGELAVDSIAHNTMTAAANDPTVTGVGVGIVKDAAAIIAPETVSAVNQDKGILETIGAAAEDTAEWAGCAVGGGIGGTAGGLVTSPTVLGVPAGVAVGAVGGCAAGSYVVGKVIDGGKAAVGAVMDFFGGEDEVSAPQGVINHGKDISAVLPAGAVLTVQSSSNDAAVTRGVVPDNQIKVMASDGQSSATVVELDRQRAMDQLRAAERAIQQQTPQQNAPAQMATR